MINKNTYILATLERTAIMFSAKKIIFMEYHKTLDVIRHKHSDINSSIYSESTM